MFIRILNSEMELATGCTEPGAVALTAAEAGQALRKAGVDKAEEITVNASINIIKNAMSAGIPGTDYEGMDYAAAIGALGGDPVYLLEVMNHVPRETVEAAAALVKAGKVRVNVAQVPQKLYIEVIAKGGGHTGRAIVRDLHTNVVLVEQDGAATLDKRDTDTAAAGDSDVVTPEQIASFLTVRSIWDYCTKELDPMNDPIDIIRSAVKVNSVISDEGLSKEYGLAIGRNLDLNCRKGLMTRDLTTNSMIAAAAGADARMAGAPVSVVANSGSGNQGITATMPVVAAARWLDIDEPTMLRAVTLSNLIAIRIKSKFGRLSNLCGATVAGTGAACGITYLLGGGYHEICCYPEHGGQCHRHGVRRRKGRLRPENFHLRQCRLSGSGHGYPRRPRPEHRRHRGRERGAHAGQLRHPQHPRHQRQRHPRPDAQQRTCSGRRISVLATPWQACIRILQKTPCARSVGELGVNYYEKAIR